MTDNHEPIDRVELAMLIDQISSMCTINTDDYNMGYHTSLMYIKRYVMGKNPFEITFDNQTVSIEREH